MDPLSSLVKSMLAYLDPNPEREGLAETPARVAAAWHEWTGGYGVNIPSLMKSFEDGSQGYDELIIVHGIPVRSFCEHHLAPITGTCDFGYLPGSRIAGLSKLPRLVDAFARRLQVQERLTVQIATTFEQYMQPRGVAVVIHAAHGCMSSRGVKIHGGSATTSCMLGEMKTDDQLRSEFLSLCQLSRSS
jgi:GTP cyclohydrolase I